MPLHCEGEAPESHCKGPGHNEGKTVVICAIYRKDILLVIQLYLQLSIGLKFCKMKSWGEGQKTAQEARYQREYTAKFNLY